jgi:hypothetical protein
MKNWQVGKKSAAATIMKINSLEITKYYDRCHEE